MYLDSHISVSTSLSVSLQISISSVMEIARFLCVCLSLIILAFLILIKMHDSCLFGLSFPQEYVYTHHTLMGGTPSRCTGNPETNPTSVAVADLSFVGCGRCLLDGWRRPTSAEAADRPLKSQFQRPLQARVLDLLLSGHD